MDEKPVRLLGMFPMSVRKDANTLPVYLICGYGSGVGLSNPYKHIYLPTHAYTREEQAS